MPIFGHQFGSISNEKGRGDGTKKKHAEKENMVTFQAVVKSKVAQVALTVTKSFFPGHILEYSSDW